MSFSQINYCQYLLSSHQNHTKTNLANHLQDVGHDTINRYLRESEFEPDGLWKNVCQDIQTSPEAALIFDDIVLDKRASQEIELVRRQCRLSR